jgi:hypothetical protein
MKKQNLLDLNNFFFNVRKIPYVIIKYDDNFPNYHKGQDIDIFCYNKSQFAQKIFETGNKYLNKGFEIKITDISTGHTQIDFLFKNELHFRFDLHQELPQFKNIKIKKHYIYSVIENAVTLQHRYKNKPYFIYVPSKTDDLLLRYIEYVEYYQLRPDKVKHLNYIVKTVKSDPERISFLDKLHLYTNLPDAFSKQIKQSFIKQITRFIKKIINNL